MSSETPSLDGDLRTMRSCAARALDCEPETTAEYDAAESRIRTTVRALQADAARWQFVRERLWVEDERMMSGDKRSCLRIAIGSSVIGDGLPRAYTPEEVEEVIDRVRSQEDSANG